ncbi:uncharacterized protein LOC123474226 [Daphnia magna]|uniref:uncharacterized protein LOC123474226 n=1 Tax=Daphnia magna TaxID=35525 RepID=UPI001E1BB6D2|nr:uncharacterized protein LOC123474226 [Daphnia magna]
MKHKLTNQQVSQILHVGVYFKTCRRKKASMTEEYKNKLRSAADTFLSDWIVNGVPFEMLEKIKSSSPSLITLFRLKQRPLQNIGNNIGIENSQSSLLNCSAAARLLSSNEEAQYRLSNCNIDSMPNNQPKAFGNNTSSIIEEPQQCDQEQPDTNQNKDATSNHPSLIVDSEKDVEDEGGVPVAFLGPDNNSWTDQNLSLKTILQHYAVYTDTKLSHMTYLLGLLIFHKPLPDYDCLPSTGEQLLHIDGRDFVGLSSDMEATLDEENNVQEETSTDNQPLRRKKNPLPGTVDLHDGYGNVVKYMHFGLESALKGDSPGLYFKHSNLLQYASIYATKPELLPDSIRKKIETFDSDLQIRKAKESLLRSAENIVPEVLNEVNIRAIPHFTIDFSLDGVQLFHNSEQSECIPIMVAVHAINKANCEITRTSSV